MRAVRTIYMYVVNFNVCVCVCEVVCEMREKHRSDMSRERERLQNQILTLAGMNSHKKVNKSTTLYPRVDHWFSVSLQGADHEPDQSKEQTVRILEQRLATKAAECCNLQGIFTIYTDVCQWYQHVHSFAFGLALPGQKVVSYVKFFACSWAWCKEGGSWEWDKPWKEQNNASSSSSDSTKFRFINCYVLHRLNHCRVDWQQRKLKSRS